MFTYLLNLSKIEISYIMKKILLILMMLFVYVTSAHVSLKKSSISTSGGTMTLGNQEVIFTVGETNIQEIDTGNMHLSEGFIGPDIVEALGITDYGTLSGISVYPNPVKEDFNLSLPQGGTYEVYLYNLQGKQIFFRQVNGTQQNFDISRLTAAGYMLIVIDRDNKLKKSFKIIKE